MGKWSMLDSLDKKVKIKITAGADLVEINGATVKFKEPGKQLR